MSERSGQSTKAKDGKTKYATLNLFNTYKGKSIETQKNSVAARHGLQSLGKVASSRRIPPPANLPSLKAENKGNDPNVNIIPKDGSGWVTKSEQQEESNSTTEAQVQESQQPSSESPAPSTQEVPTPVVKSWAQTNNKHTGQGDGIQCLNTHFQHEFPSLQAAGDLKELPDEAYGPGPSLRPPNVTSWRDGGGKTLPIMPGCLDQDGRPCNLEDGGTGTSELNDKGLDKRDGREKASLPLSKINGQLIIPPAPQFRGLMPPYMSHSSKMQLPHRLSYPAPNIKSQSSSLRQQHSQWCQDLHERPSIISASELKELDNLDTENDDGWAGAQSEVDYTEKLNFSDEDEGTSTKKDEEESCDDRDEQISKAEQLGTKTSESFNGPKEINECPGNKTSSNESATMQVASQSPTKISSIRSLQTDRQESGRSAVQAVVRELRGLGNTSVNQKPAPQHPSPPNRQIGPGKYAAAKPSLLPSDSDEAWRQRRKPSMSDLSAAVERARKRREEEERRMEEQRLAACAAKLKKLDEKYGTLSKEKKENAKEKDKIKIIEKENTKDIEKENTKCNENDKANRKENEGEKWKETEKQQEKEQEQEKVAEQRKEKEPEKKEHEKKEQEEQQGQEEKIEKEFVPELEQPQQQEQEQETEKEEEKDEVEGEPEQRQEEPRSEPDDFKGQKEEDDLKKTEDDISPPIDQLDSTLNEKEVTPTSNDVDGDLGSQTRPAVPTGYSKQFQKSLPPRFQRQQEQMMKQQWQQQPSGVHQQTPSQTPAQPPTQAQPQPAGAPVPPPQHRSLYQTPLAPPHHQHLASMGFDPRWIMMQSYMDPRMISGRPPMDMTQIHPGMMPPKLMRRDQMDSSGSGSDSFDHLSRPTRDHTIQSTEPRLVWSSEAYPHTEPQQATTPPVVMEESKDTGPEMTVEQERKTSAYSTEKRQLSPHLNLLNQELFREKTDEEKGKFANKSLEDVQPVQSDKVADTVNLEPVDLPVTRGAREEPVLQTETRTVLKRSLSHGSNHSLKSEVEKSDSLPLAIKIQHRSNESKDQQDKPEEKSKKESKAFDGAKNEKQFRRESRHDTRWGPRPGSRRDEGYIRPVRRCGPIKKPVLRDMKEEREQRKEKEDRQSIPIKGNKTSKTEKKEPSQAVNKGVNKTEPEKSLQESSMPVVKKTCQDVKPLVDKSETVPPVMPVNKTGNNQATSVPAPKDEKQEKPPVKNHLSERQRIDNRFPIRRDSGLPPRNYRKEVREQRDWFPDQGYRGRGRGEFYSRGRSFRGSYNGRGRGGRGRSREYPRYREPRPRLEHVTSVPSFRQREESETRSESSDFEEIPKRRRQHGSETDSDTEAHESASDTISDKENPSKGKRLKKEGRPESKPIQKSFRSESNLKVDNRSSEKPPLKEDDPKPKPGFLPRGEPSRRGRGGMFRGGGRGAGGRGGSRSAPLRKPGPSNSIWPPRLDTSRRDDSDVKKVDHFETVPFERRHVKSERKFDHSRERLRKQRPPRPPRQDKPPRFRRLREREAAAKVNETSATAMTNATPSSSVQEHAHSLDVAGSKSPDLSNQNSSDQANEEWETASESSDFNERRERDEKKMMDVNLQASTKSGESNLPKRDAAKRSFSSQRPGADRQNRRSNSGANKPNRNYSGTKNERRSGMSSKPGRRGLSKLEQPFEERTAMIGVDPTSSNMAHQPGECSNTGTAPKSAKDVTGKKREDSKSTKKPKEKPDALSQFDLNNYASVVIIDDHPEVTTVEDSQCSTTDDGFTEVVSKKQQKRLQDEERRKKEEQVVQNWNKKNVNDKGRGQNSKLPPRFAKKQQQAAQQAQVQTPTSVHPQVQPQQQAGTLTSATVPVPDPALIEVPAPTISPTETAVTVQEQSKVQGGNCASGNNAENSVSGKAVAPPQMHSTLEADLWDNKINSTAVLSEVTTKLVPISPPQPPPVSAWNKPLTSFGSSPTPEGTGSSQESGSELAIDSDQLAAKINTTTSTNITATPITTTATTAPECEVTSVEKAAETKLPEPKEQRQKQPRAGPIKAQKIPELNPVENKEHKPGPIGKERSLKNRKVKDIQQTEAEGKDESPVANIGSPEPVVTPEPKVVTELSTEAETMISVPPPEFEENSKESMTDYTAPSSSLSDSVSTDNGKIEDSLVSNVPLHHTLPIPRRETLQQSSSLTPVSPTTVDFTLKMECARKAWENSPTVGEKTSPVTSSASPITSANGGSNRTYSSFSSASMPPIPVASVTPTTSLSGAGTYTTSSLSTKATTTSDPPNICKVKPQQLQNSNMAPASHFSQLSCVTSLIPPQQQSPQVYVSQSAAGPGAQIPTFYMDTSHLFGAQHPRLAPPSLAQQQGFQTGPSQPTAVQQISIPIYAPIPGQPQAQLSLGGPPSVSQAQEMFNTSLQPFRTQQAFMQNSLSQPSPVVLSGTALHNFSAVQAQDLAKAQSGLAFQQTSNAQPIPILYEHSLNQASGLGGSQLIDTHLIQARPGLTQPSNLYTGQVQQPGQSNYYSTAQSPNAALQQVTLPLPGSQLSLPNFGSAGQPLIALPQSLQPLQHAPAQAQPHNLSRPTQINQPFRGLIATGAQAGMIPAAGKMAEMDLKPYGCSVDVKPGTPPISVRSITPTSSPFRASSTSPNSQSSKINNMVYQKQFSSAAGVRIAQPFPAQFPPQMLSQPNLVPPLVRPHGNTFSAPVQRPPMPLANQMQPQMTTGIICHTRPQHTPRVPSGPAQGIRGNQVQAAMMAEQDLKAKQRAEVLQSTHKFFSDQQQQIKQPVSKGHKNDSTGGKPTESGGSGISSTRDEKVEEKPNSSQTALSKPVRTGPIKPQAVKTEETKS
ncbi:protein PRRC2C isoform X4 [Stegostoma tigrinum]|uniref:protein PRRC2C isoform X4 n=1 Tax=Stegostoma tigrinum TaxID=3053191 RepID=UPI00287074BB|nr:protein PRRC2C isoform X4 [Stegostoma tigrinum]